MVGNEEMKQQCKCSKRATEVRPWYVNNSNNRSNANDRNNFNNNGRFLRIAWTFAGILAMKTYKHLWNELCSYENLYLAYKKARKHKSNKDYVINFERDLKDNLLLLRFELLLHSYKPKPLVNFIVRDPKTRKISKSDFRDRIVHHALCNVLEPIFEKLFIYDSYANRKDKGTIKAIQRFDYFKRKASKNNTFPCYVLKADIKKFFETVDYNILMDIIRKKISDNKVLWLIRKIVCNSVDGGDCIKGMPLGNLTSQFFANTYLNELDQFIKHNLKVKYYIRYVDDFVILDQDKCKLRKYENKINHFLNQRLKIELHPDKSKIIRLKNKLVFLGFRVFYYHKLLKKQNLKKMIRKYDVLKEKYHKANIDYDVIYDFFEGWIAYAKNANTFKLRKRLSSKISKNFPNEISSKEINRSFKKLKKGTNSIGCISSVLKIRDF
ncbi:MAG: reverse transcriptase/maturase family protein [Candidatus Woesearchaeota archaeon]